MPPRASRKVLAEADNAPAPAATRSSRASAKRSMPPPPESDDEASDDESDAEKEDVKPNISKGRTAKSTRTSATSSVGATRPSKAKTTNASTGPAKGRGSRAAARSSTPSSVGDDEEVLEEEGGDEEEEASKEEVVAKPKARRGAASRKAAPKPPPVQETEEEEEEEDVKPASRKGRRGRVVASETPEVEDTPEQQLSPEPDHAEGEQASPHAASADNSEDDQGDDAPVDEPANALPKEAADIPSTPPRKANAPHSDSENENGDAPKAPKRVPVTASPAQSVVAPPVINTAHDLVAQARQAAINHAALAKEREKEREGKPRLVIHQLVLEDFKSYRGRGVIGPFHKSFSSIVGPNGSGKSNTIDALLFVFGYRASKMRQGKLSELIHNSGPVESPDATSADISVATTLAADASGDGGEFEDDGEESEEEQWDTKKKGKGKGKGKGKAKAKKGPAPPSNGINSCMVEVHFREVIDLPNDDFSVVPGSQLVVSRTAFRDNSSVYKINGKSATFTQVTSLLKGRGIDLDHNRFLILQGEVESIAQMKPKGVTEHDEGLLEYLEDIIGTARFKTEIEAAIVEVEKLNDDRTVQLNRVKLVEREKSALEGRKKEADAFLRDQNELVHNQSTYWQVKAFSAREACEEHTQAATDARAALDQEVESQKGIREEVDTLQKEHDTLAKATKTAEKETAALVSELTATERHDVKLQENKKSLNAKVKKMKKAITDDTHNRSEADTWVRNHSEEIEKVRASLDTMETTLEAEETELEKVRDSLKGKTEVFSTQIESLQKEQQPWAAKIAEKQAAIDLVANERDLLLERTEGIKAALEEAEAALAKLTTGDKDKETRLAELKAEKREVEKQIAASQAQIDAMAAEDAKLRSKASAARQKSDEAKASQTASRSQGNVLSSLTKLRDQGRLNGFHGRLGDLGSIDSKYDIAISTACPALDNLVSDTIEVGQACIEHLRKNDLGRANVMCLKSLPQRDLSPIQTPENALRLFDLVTFKDAKFAPAFFQVLNNTLVADDLTQGKRLAYGASRRWRVVTLDGQLIDSTGTMSGGGGRPSKGRMGSKIAAESVSPEHVAKCEQEQSTAVEALRVFVADRSRLEKELVEHRKRLPNIETAISKAEMDINTSSKRVEEATKRIAELKTQSKPEAGEVKRIAEFEKEIGQLSAQLTKLQNESSAIDEKIKVLQDKILEVGGVRLRGQQTKVSDLKSRIDHANDRLTKAEVGKAKSQKDAAKLVKAIESNEKALVTTEAELEAVLEQIKAGAEDSDELRNRVEKAQIALADQQEELAELKGNLDEKVEVMTQFRAKERELKQALDASQKLLDQATKEINHWTDKIGELELHNFVDSDDEDDEEKDDDEEPKAPKAAKVLRQWTAEEMPQLDTKVLKGKIAALEDRLSKSNLDLAVIQEYARREEEFLKRAADLDAVTKERDAAKKMADDLRGQRLKEFMEGFGIISMKLKEMYQMITLGGNAELELVDSLDPFSEGIIFSVMPPKKSWKNISNLSGGEKTLSSLALVFALHVFKPTPLYFMDEIDAALDFRNVSIVANYIKAQTKSAQFIVISLRNNMFELSSRLVGIYKVANQTRSIAIDNKDISAISSAPVAVSAGAAPPAPVSAVRHDENEPPAVLQEDSEEDIYS